MNDLDHLMQRLGRILAADQSLVVEVRGELAYATPGRVVLPAIECYQHLGPGAWTMLQALADHECGHAADTTFDWMETANKQSPALGLLLNAIEDGYVEGRRGRIYAGSAINLAAKNNWFWTTARPSEGHLKGLQSVPERIKTLPLWDAFCLAVTMVVRPHGGRSIEEIETLNPVVGEMLRLVEDDLAQVATLFDQSQQTPTCFRIAKRIFDRFTVEREETEDADDDESGEDEDAEEEESGSEGPGGEGSSDSESEEGGEEEEGAGGDRDRGADGDPDRGDDAGGSEGGDDVGGAEESRAPDSSGDDSSDADSDDSDEASDAEGAEGSSDDAGEPDELADEDAADRGDVGAAGDEEDEEEPSLIPKNVLLGWDPSSAPINPERAVLKLIQQIFSAPDNQRPYIVFDPSFDIERDFTEEDTRHLTADFDRFQNEASLASAALVSVFETALKAKRERRPVPGADEGEIEPTMMIEYAVGSARADEIYQQYVQEDDESTAVAILVDCSGSMVGSKAHLARLVAIAMTEALTRCQVPNEVTGFTTVDSTTTGLHWWTHGSGVKPKYDAHFAHLRRIVREAHERGTDFNHFARTVLSPEAPARSVLRLPIYGVFKRFDSEDARALCWIEGLQQNLDGEAVLWQARRLATRPERRRVMFVLSDGWPAGARNDEQGARYLKESVERVISAGIEIYGIGIQSEAVCDYYPKWWVCSDLDELVELAMGALTETILASRTERQWIADRL